VPAQQTVDSPRAKNVRPYRVQVSVRDRLRDGPGMFIEDVWLVVDDARPAPAPTRAWLQPVGDEDLKVNPYDVVYQGRPPGDGVLAAYRGEIPDAPVRLKPMELDYLTLTLPSPTGVSLHFRVRVAYRLLDEQTTRTLTLRDRFSAVFADSHDWLPYQL